MHLEERSHLGLVGVHNRELKVVAECEASKTYATGDSALYECPRFQLIVELAIGECCGKDEMFFSLETPRCQ